MEKKTFPIFALVQTLLCALFLIGLLTVLGPCGPKEDGGWMTCHWAGRGSAGVAALLFLLSLVRLFANESGIRAGLDIASVLAAVLAALVPGTLIGLCMMADMHCRSVTQPSVIVFSVLIGLLSVVDFTQNIKQK